MKTKMACRRIAIGLAFAALLPGCERKQESAVPSAASQPASTAAAASQPTGPIIAPQASLPVPTEGARKLGATLAAEGATNVNACASCHGPMGEGNAATGFPRLAGQSYVYLLHELDSYVDESRSHPVMTGIAKTMTKAQREAGAAYYASLEAPAATATSGSGTGATQRSVRTGKGDRAQQLASVGDESRKVQACANCHGPEGIGLGVHYPYLAGQHAAYLSSTLNAWRDGTRRNDPAGQMPLIAKALLDEDIQALARYYAQLPPPPRRDADLEPRTAPAAASASAVVSGPRSAASQVAQGVGSEQGVLTGGSQGPGGESPASASAPNPASR